MFKQDDLKTAHEPREKDFAVDGILRTDPEVYVEIWRKKAEERQWLG